MGVYSHYDSAMSGNGNVVAADESYAGAIGAYQMIEESEINSYNIFESVIGRDFAEAGNSFGVVSESDMEAINEASVSGIWEKVVTFVQKIWAKIKGILTSIKTKIEGTITRDSKALYKKYEKTVNSKLNNGKLSDFKFKWKSFADGKNVAISDAAFGGVIKGLFLETGVTIKTAIDDNMKQASMFKFNHDEGTFGILNGKLVANSRKSDEIAKVNDTEDRGKNAANYGIRPYTSDECTDMLEAALADICKGANNKYKSNSVTAKEFPKEIHDCIFDDEEEKDKFSEVLDEIRDTLGNGKKVLDGITKAQNEIDKYFKNEKKKASDIARAMQKANESQATQSKMAAIANRFAGRTTTCLNIASRASGMAFAAATSVVKEHIKQCRAVWIKAAAYNQKKAPYEEATLLEAMADVSDYEVEEMFSMM